MKGWTKASDLPAENGRYVCRISNGFDVYKKEIELFNGCWVLSDEDEEVIEWLDESLADIHELTRLRAWKLGAAEILKNIDLQECGKLLKLQPGSDISKHILPALQKFTKQADEKNLGRCQTCGGKWSVYMGGPYNKDPHCTGCRRKVEYCICKP